MGLAHRENLRLKGLCIDRAIPCPKPICQIGQGCTFLIGRGAEGFRRFDEVLIVAHGKPGRRIQPGMGFGRGLRRVAADKAPHLFGILGPGSGGKIEQHREGHNHVALRHILTMDVEHGVGQPGLFILIDISTQLLVVFVHSPGDHIEMHPLCGLGLLIHEIGQALGRGIGQPFVDRNSVAGGFGDLLALVIEEQFIGEMLRCRMAEDAADPVIDRGVGGMVLAIHLEIDTQRRPARTEIGLPLQLYVAARNRDGPLAAIRIVEGDGATGGVDGFHGHIEHPARLWMDRQKDRIGLAALFAQRLEHDGHDLVILFRRAQQHSVKLAALVELRGRIERVLKAESIEEPAQHSIVVIAKAVMGAKGIGHGRQRLLQMFGEHLLIGHIARHLAHPIHIIREADQAGGNV